MNGEFFVGVTLNLGDEIASAYACFSDRLSLDSWALEVFS